MPYNLRKRSQPAAITQTGASSQNTSNRKHAATTRNTQRQNKHSSRKTPAKRKSDQKRPARTRKPREKQGKPDTSALSAPQNSLSDADLASMCGTGVSKPWPPGSDPRLIAMGYEFLGTTPQSVLDAQSAQESTSEIQQQQAVAPSGELDVQSAPKSTSELQQRQPLGPPGGECQLQLDPGCREEAKRNAFVASFVRSWDNLMEGQSRTVGLED
ncbi:hypothetical protein AJ79_01343 [Helicocarpus griseus UAMH5409]|uniref:Uncharacterized protein n=1 Tax=Helicocarpus griseus UAMH5409 TaxID=1447875 RepID=A0A2B7Y7J3_9EURO|nr:hypothetical protein AJ79_01343 [Helicocarpus griseus UAMH5409]